MDINKKTASKIKELRTNMGFTSEYVAQELNLAKSNYSQMENGKVEISISRLQALADIFKVPLNALLPVSEKTTIQVTNGDNSPINGTQINHFTDPSLVESIKSAISLLQDSLEKAR